MNILLLDGLPEEYEGIPISTDFRNMIQADLILSDPDIGKSEKIYCALDQLYPEIPADINKAVEGLMWFFRRGNQEEISKSSKKAFDFDQDAGLIFAAFYATYGISLTTIDYLHWWEFMALFEGLPETTLIQRAIYYRTADFGDMGKEERKRALKIRQAFEIKSKQKKLSREDLDRQTINNVQQRFAEARRKAGLLNLG